MPILKLERRALAGPLPIVTPRHPVLTLLGPRHVVLDLARQARPIQLRLRRPIGGSASVIQYKPSKGSLKILAAAAAVVLLVGGGVGYQAYVKQLAREQIAKAGMSATANGLLMSIARGHAELIDAYKKIGVSPATTPRLIEAAIESNSVEVLKAVLAVGAKLENEPNSERFLATAIQADNAAMLKAIADLGVDLNRVTGGKSPLLVAAAARKWGALQQLVELGADVKVTGSGDDSLAHLIVPSDDPALFDRVLGKGGEVNQANAKGETPLLFAVHYQAYKLIPRLLEAGADPLQASASGASPLKLALNQGDDQSLELFFKAKPAILEALDEKKLMTFLVRQGMDRSMGAVAGKSVDVNLVLEDGLTPLTLAVTTGQVKILKVLLEKGADPNLPVNLPSAAGVTPLMLAAFVANLEVVEALLGAGAHPDKAASDGATALDIANQYGKFDIVRRLQQAQVKQ